MSSPITEIVVLSANDALKADPSIFLEFKRVLAAKTTPAGMIGHVWGPRVEEPEVWQGFLNWISLEHHKRVVPSLETDQEFGEAIGRIISGPPNVTHVQFAPFDNYKGAVAAPLTEVVLIKVKDGADLQEFKDAVENALDGAGSADGCTRGAWGYTVEDEKAAVMVVGWESREAHDKYGATQASKDTGVRFMKVGDVEKLFYIKLQ